VHAPPPGRTAELSLTPPTLMLLDSDQIARKLGVSRSTVTPMVEHPELPGPLGYFRGRLVWSEPTVDGWSERCHADRTAQRDKISQEKADVPEASRPIS